jgi:D-lactate dehydrogenase
MTRVLVYSSKPHDRDLLPAASAVGAVDWQFEPGRLTPDTARLAAGFDAACIFVNDSADGRTLQVLAECGVRLLALRCAGYDHVDLTTARQQQISVVRVPAYSPHAVAEHTVALLMALVRRIPQAHRRVREFDFSHRNLTGFDLHGKTAGIVGTGRIGKIVAQILKGVGMHVRAMDPFPSEDWARAHGIEYADFDTLVASSKVLSLHLPLNVETRNCINAAVLARMPKGSVLLNTGRGGLVDTEALIRALKSGHLEGAALDVYEGEAGLFFEDLSGKPLPDDQLSLLINLPNLLLTAHQGFLTTDALAEIARVTAENLGRFHAGKAFLDGTYL